MPDDNHLALKTSIASSEPVHAKKLLNYILFRKFQGHFSKLHSALTKIQLYIIIPFPDI